MKATHAALLLLAIYYALLALNIILAIMLRSYTGLELFFAGFVGGLLPVAIGLSIKPDGNNK